MGFLTGNRRARPRRFDYEPRYYDPKRDESLKRRMRIQSKARRRRSPLGLLYLLALLLFAVYIYRTLGR
ncbi:MAG: hypothetical protein OXM02_08675 [Bacteroidota bacterium]|nr:hypothetical protein [Bacteroidota bacterium]MDE2834583.1 hypothetical protein [Bacteroidota bacterium]MDE2956284.1 hypothetical protein [Bacteroidota bacterium]